MKSLSQKNDFLMRERGLARVEMREPEPLTSKSLILRIRDASDTDSWSQFDTLYSPIVRSYCRRRGVQEADVDDLVQEVMVSVSKAIRSFEYDASKGRFRGWFGTIVANKLKTFRSRQLAGREHLDLSFECTSLDANGAVWDAVFCQQIFHMASKNVRDRVEPMTWSCFKATWMDNEVATDVAKRLGLPIQSVYVNKSRVLQMLENEVRRLADDFPVSNQLFDGSLAPP
jgi:RNA polymerase sigma-70 factor (ECF subfamily)